MRYRRRNYSYHSRYGRRRLNWGKVIFVVCLFVLIIGLIIGLNFRRIQLIAKGYSFSEQNTILKLEKADVKTILNEEKIDHIKDWIAVSEEAELYDEYEQYFTIYNTESYETIVSEIDSLFLKYENEIKELGYSDTIFNLLARAKAGDVEYLLRNDYKYDDIKNYMNISGFKCQSISQYMEVYKDKNNYNYAVLITEYPFIISSNKVNQTYTITNPDCITNIVKLGIQLPEDYEPEDLVDITAKTSTTETLQLRKEANDALNDMFADASKLGYDLVVNSAYRSYSEQTKVYNDTFARYDEVTAAGLVAKPGASEHQTGLGVDLTCTTVLNFKAQGIAAFFGDSEEGKWVAENCYKYGFILRFPTESKDITGISNEPWHFRYVGKEAAEVIYENDWILEEYCLNKGVFPEVE